MRATQAAKEKAWIFVKSQTKTVNGILTEDDVSAYTSNNLNKSVQLGTTDGEVYFNRGICHKFLGNDSQAAEDFSKASDLGYSE